MSIHPGSSYLRGILGQVEWDALSDFGGQLAEDIGFEATDHNLAQSLVQLVQVGRPPTIPLPPIPEVPVRDATAPNEEKS